MISTVDKLADYINAAKPGMRLLLEDQAIALMSWNSWHYATWQQALMAKVIGSSWGVLEIIEQPLGGYGFVKHAESGNYLPRDDEMNPVFPILSEHLGHRS